MAELKKQKGGVSCAYPECPSKSGQGISLFRFPKDNNRAKAWLVACNREDLLNKDVLALPNYRLCEKHFDKKHMTKGEIRKTLFADAMPTIFSHLKRKAIEDNLLVEPPSKMIGLSSSSAEKSLAFLETSTRCSSYPLCDVASSSMTPQLLSS